MREFICAISEFGKVFVLFIIVSLFCEISNAAPVDTSQLLKERFVTIEKKVNDIENKLTSTQDAVYDAFSQNIKTMVDSHQISQNQLNYVYNFIYGFFILVTAALGLGGYFGFKSLRDLKKYSQDRVESIISMEVNNVRDRVINKIEVLGLDPTYMMNDIKEVIRLQQLYYQMFQLQSSDSQKDIAINAIINNSGTDNDLVITLLKNLLSKNEKPYIRSLTCVAILVSKSADVIYKSEASQILKEMLKGNNIEIAAAKEAIDRLKKYGIDI